MPSELQVGERESDGWREKVMAGERKRRCKARRIFHQSDPFYSSFY